MATPRLPFLWPFLYNIRAVPGPRSRATKALRGLHGTTCRRQDAQISQRYGNANQPPPQIPSSKMPSTDPMLDATEAIPMRAPPSAQAAPDDNPKESILKAVLDPIKASGEGKDKREAKEEKPRQEQQEQQQTNQTTDEHLPSIKAPHIEPPPYVHHFDTYGLVKRLKEGGWEEKQAITVMKAVRLMLADNTDLAKEALVSKSNLENEAYLFKAACAELKTEVTTRRRSEQEKMRTERTQLQHEVDILSQRLGQDTAALKDELKGMFDDRRMAVRNEQRDMESKVQQLNYRITVSLQADAKSEVEGLRMIMTRRVILTLGLVVFMVVGSLKLNSDAKYEDKKPQMATAGSQTELGPEVVVREGDNPGFVSLG